MKLKLRPQKGGKPIDAMAALQAGLIDQIAEGDLLEAALYAARRMAKPAPTLARPVRLAQDSEGFLSAVDRFRAKARGQMSPVAAIEAVERTCDLSADDALAAERETFLKLKASDQSAALRRLFFAERNTLKDSIINTMASSLKT